MSRPIDYKKKAIRLIEQLSKQYPSYGLGRHLATALSDYGDFWGISDKELCYAIEKYEAELALDIENVAPDEYVAKIVEDGKHLFDEEEEEDEEDGY